MEDCADNFKKIEKKYPILQSYVGYPWNEKTVEAIKNDFPNYQVRQINSHIQYNQIYYSRGIICCVSDGIITSIIFG